MGEGINLNMDPNRNASGQTTNKTRRGYRCISEILDSGRFERKEAAIGKIPVACSLLFLSPDGRKLGSFEGSLWGSNGEGKGRMANAPPPDAFQLTLMYFYNALSIQSGVNAGAGTHSRAGNEICVPSAVGEPDVVDA